MAPRPRHTTGPTTRQCQIAARIADGLSYREIGHALGISELTVRQHVRALATQLPNNDDLPPRVLIRLWMRQQVA